jgi:uridine phosphorylase
MSTGIGTENIDIVMNELDALVNIDLKNKEFKTEHSALQLFRMGTCGSVNPDVQVDNMLVTQNVVGLDGLMHFYQDYEFENDFPEIYGKFPYPKIKPMLYLQTGQKNWENCTRMQNITEIPLLSQAFMLHREDSFV